MNGYLFLGSPSTTGHRRLHLTGSILKIGTPLLQESAMMAPLTCPSLRAD